jgi:hypothetical protein
MDTIAARSYTVGDIQDQFAALLRRHNGFETVESLGFALTPMTHVRLGDTDDPVGGCPLPDLRLAILISDDIITQNLGQEPAKVTHLVIVALFRDQVQGGLYIFDQDLKVAQSLLGIRPVNIGFAVLTDVALDQVLYPGRASLALARNVEASSL